MAPEAPLWISPLFQKDDGGENESYRTVKRLVSKTPNPSCAETAHGEVETSLEECLGPAGEVLWRRVAVRGCVGPDPVLHASFFLPDDDYGSTFAASDDNEHTFVEDHTICWASFPERPNHKLLCVLASPILLCIWDVYPLSEKISSESIGGGEGNFLTLPFEARSIFPLADNNGLLLQRKQTIEDHLMNDDTRSAWMATRGVDVRDDYDGDFVLQDPPAPVRLGTMLSSPSGMEMSIPQPSPHVSAGTFGVPVPSLFSLKHPLDEILPIALIEDNDLAQAFSPPDILEKVLFVGALRWAEHDDNPYHVAEYTQPICLTYHQQLKRHAVWLINTAPPPTPTPPLWQVSRNQREEHGFDADIGAYQEMNVLAGGPEADISWHGTTNRNEALADALGVSSRKPEDHITSRGRAAERSRRSSGLKKPTASMFSPMANVHNTPMHSISNETKKMGQNSIDMSGTSPEKKQAAIIESPFADLCPEFAVTLIYEEEAESSDSAATNIFIASNLEASGLLDLCYTCPLKSDLNPQELRRLSFTPTKASGSAIAFSESQCHEYSVVSMASIPCISAQPIQATPVPLCFVPPTQRRDTGGVLATDVLVLTQAKSRKRNGLVLYRSGLTIANCALPDASISDRDRATNVVGIENPVGDCIDFLCSNNGKTGCTRGKLCLHFPSSSISSTALSSCDAAFFLPDANQSCSEEAVETALQIRVDSVRLAQALSGRYDSGHALTEDTCWSAVECVLSCFIESLTLDGSVLSTSPKRKKASSDGNWLALLDSDFDKAFRSEAGSSLYFGPNEYLGSSMVCEGACNVYNELYRTIQPAWIVSGRRSPGQTFCVFDTLHLLYEEAKLSVSRSMLSKIGSLLARICLRSGFASGDLERSANRMNDFLDHYRRDLGPVWLECIEKTTRASCDLVSFSRIDGSHYREILTSFLTPPSFLEWVDSKMKACNDRDEISIQAFYDKHESAKIPVVFRKTRALHRVYSALYGEDTSVQSINDDKVVQLLIDEGMNDANQIRDELPAGLALPITEVFIRCRSNPEMCTLGSLSSDAWSLIGRTDMSKQSEQHTIKSSQTKLSGASPALGQHYQDLLADRDKDGILPLEVTSSKLFPDNRIHEVGKLLRSSRPIYLLVTRAPEVSDHDYERLKQERLSVLCRRTFATPLGRGMLTLGNLKPIPADPLPVPLLCLSGRVPPTNAALALDTTSGSADLTVWPEFHNAVAAGLRLPFNENASEETLRQITRSWIVFNGNSNQVSSQQNSDSPDSQTPVNHGQGGLLMAIGLRGHLSALKMTDIYDYLTDGVVTTTVGVLIGMAANKRGSCDPAASKMLCLHIPSLLPSSFTGIDVASPAQAAAIAGIGLLYQGSSNRMMTEFLLEEMGKRPTNDSIMPDREAYALSCGLSLGMVNLAKGGNSSDGFDGIESGLADLDIGERLHRLVVGGIDHPEQQKRRKEAAERFSNITGNESESCFSIFEGDTVNTDVTAPGATLALGLMYLKSGNHAVASSMALPDTHFLLEYIRPDLLLLRVLSRAMILWDEVKPTRDWIEKQIPVVVQRSYHEMRSLVEGASAFPNRSSGGNNDSVGNVEPASALTGTTSGGRHDAVSSTFRDESIDKNAVRQIYVHIIAGACFGIGLRFAGTGDKQAASVVAEKLVELKILRDGNDQVSVALRPELQILEMCIGCTAISLAMIMAGTGNLETFNLLKTIRWRCDDDIGYGSHMAYGAAIGLLFLGGGSCTLGRSPEDIAALLMAFFPRLPSTTSDNQHHLQALRHCYALAVERREIRAVDSETGTIVSVPVEITFAEDSIPKKKITAPCLLLNSNGTAKTLQVLSEQYYPLAIDIGRQSTHASGITFFVKRKHGYLGSSGMTSSRRSLVVHADSGKISARKLVEAFTENPSVVAYSQYLCEDSSRPLSWVSNFCTRILEQCLRNNTIEALSLYLKLKSSVVAMKEDCPASIDAAWDTRLIRTYYAHSTISGSSTTRLLSAEFVSTLNELVEQTLSASPLDENDVLVYMKTGDPRQTVVKDVSQLGLLGSFLSFYGVPFPLPNDSNVDTS